MQGMALIGIYPGSFDPLHHGHVDIVRRASRVADRLVVAVLENPAKAGLFSVAERLELLSTCLKGMRGVEVGTFRGLLVDYAREQGASVVFRGLRAVSDFEYEFQMTLMNRTLNPDLETVFLTPSQDLTFLSSRLVKEVSALGGSIGALVPAPVLQALKAKHPPRA
jgi:pantetheine-phosphate adenylyltransferase